MSESRTLKVFWDYPKHINVGIGQQLVELNPGDPWEMDEAEALARIAQGDCRPVEPKAHAAALKRLGRSEPQEAQEAVGDAQTTTGAEVTPEGGRPPRSRTRAT
jgi:hypothetical protein